MSAVEEAGDGFEQSAVAAAAAAAMTFAEDPADIAWGRSVMARVLPMEDKTGVFEDSKNSFDPRLYMATALFHCLKRGRAESGDAEALLKLAASSNSHVGEYAITALLRSQQDLRLTFIAGALASELFCTHASKLNDDGSRDRSADRTHTVEALTRAIDRLHTDATFAFTPPPAPWEFSAPPRRSWDTSEPRKAWRHPSFFFEQRSAAALLQKFPVEAWLSQKPLKAAVLDYADALIGWTKERLYPAWRTEERERSETDLFEWLHGLGDFVTRLLPFMEAEEFLEKLVRPIAEHKDEDGLRYVSAVATALVCRAVYDAKTVSDDAMTVLDYCLSRMLAERVFVRNSYRAGEVRGWDLAPMIRALMFVSVKDAFGAVRFANNEWGELPRVVPIVDRMMAGAGWATFVMDCYLTLCERAGGAMPVEAFMRHVMANIGAQKDHPQDWRENVLLARIAGVVQGLAEANYPLQREQAHSLLSVLDSLVDLGDRRAAALQQSEYFRGVQVESKAA